MSNLKKLIGATLVSVFAVTAYAQTEQAVEGVNNPNRSSVADVKERFTSADANQDGMMDENEFNTYQTSLGGVEQADEGVNNPNRSSVANTKPRFFADYDANTDGMMDEEEFSLFEQAWQKEQGVGTSQ